MVQLCGQGAPSASGRLSQVAAFEGRGALRPRSGLLLSPRAGCRRARRAAQKGLRPAPGWLGPAGGGGGARARLQRTPSAGGTPAPGGAAWARRGIASSGAGRGARAELGREASGFATTLAPTLYTLSRLRLSLTPAGMRAPDFKDNVNESKSLHSLAPDLSPQGC